MSPSSAHAAWVAAISICGLLACQRGAAEDRDLMLRHADATRLAGAWKVTMVLERPLLTLRIDPPVPPPVTGSMAFTENRRGEGEVSGFGVVTNRGISDLDLHDLSLPFGGPDAGGRVLARTAPVVPSGDAPGPKDSVVILLQSDDARLTITFSGMLQDDSIGGTWVAEYLRHEAAGHFTMRRDAVRQ